MDRSQHIERIREEDILAYIEERTMAKDTTTWADVKMRFGGDPTFLIDGKLYRPANLPPQFISNLLS